MKRRSQRPKIRLRSRRERRNSFTEPKHLLQPLSQKLQKRLHRLQKRLRMQLLLILPYSLKRLLDHQLRNNPRRKRRRINQKRKKISPKKRRTSQKKKKSPKKFTKRKSLKLFLNLKNLWLPKSQRRNLIASSNSLRARRWDQPSKPKSKLSSNCSWPRRKRSADFRSTLISKTQSMLRSLVRTLN